LRYEKNYINHFIPVPKVIAAQLSTYRDQAAV